MALSARVPSGADTAGFVPEIWSNLVLEAVHNQLVCWGAIDGRWQSDLKKGDTVNIGIVNTVAASEVVVGTKATSLDPATGTKVPLIVNQWWQAPVDVDYMTIRQSQVDWAAQAQREAAYAVGKKMDTTIATLFSTLGGSTYPNSDGATLDDDTLLSLVQTLDEADVPRDGQRFLIIDPSALVDILKIDKFIAAQYVNIGAVTNGIVGTTPVYACQVRITNNLVAATTGSYGVMMHRYAIAGAAQMEPSWVKEYEDLHLRRYQSEALWGVKEVRDTFGKAFYTRSA